MPAVFQGFKRRGTVGQSIAWSIFTRMQKYIGVQCSGYSGYSKYFRCLYCGYCLYHTICTAHSPSTRRIQAFNTAHTPSTPSIQAASTLRTVSTRSTKSTRCSENRVYTEYRVFSEHLCIVPIFSSEHKYSSWENVTFASIISCLAPGTQQRAVPAT